MLFTSSKFHLFKLRWLPLKFEWVFTVAITLNLVLNLVSSGHQSNLYACLTAYWDRALKNQADILMEVRALRRQGWGGAVTVPTQPEVCPPLPVTSTAAMKRFNDYLGNREVLQELVFFFITSLFCMHSVQWWKHVKFGLFSFTFVCLSLALKAICKIQKSTNFRPLCKLRAVQLIRDKFKTKWPLQAWVMLRGATNFKSFNHEGKNVSMCHHFSNHSVCVTFICSVGSLPC